MCACIMYEDYTNRTRELGTHCNKIEAKGWFFNNAHSKKSRNPTQTIHLIIGKQTEKRTNLYTNPAIHKKTLLNVKNNDKKSTRRRKTYFAVTGATGALHSRYTTITRRRVRTPTVGRTNLYTCSLMVSLSLLFSNLSFLVSLVVPPLSFLMATSRANCVAAMH